MKFNLAKTRDVTSAVVEIKDPVTGAPVGATVELAGPEHPKRKAIEFARQRKIRAGLAKTGKIDVGDPADDEHDSIDLLVECTLGWSGITDDTGAAIEFSVDAVRELYATPGLTWLRGQLLVAMGERERFIKSFATA